MSPLAFLQVLILSLSPSVFLLTESWAVPPCSHLRPTGSLYRYVPPCGTGSLCLQTPTSLAPSPHPTIQFGNMPSSLQPLCLYPQTPVHPSLSHPGSLPRKCDQEAPAASGWVCLQPTLPVASCAPCRLAGAPEHLSDLHGYPFCLWIVRPGYITGRGLWASLLACLCECTL